MNTAIQCLNILQAAIQQEQTGLNFFMIGFVITLAGTALSSILYLTLKNKYLNWRISQLVLTSVVGLSLMGIGVYLWANAPICS